MPDIKGSVRVVAIDGPSQDFLGVIDPQDEWVYVQRFGGQVTMWSGPACGYCKVQGVGVRRCHLHRDLIMVAVQLSLL